MVTIDSRAEIRAFTPKVEKATPSFDIDFGTMPENGHSYDQNEDAYFFNIKNGSFGVFDGMGGKANGRESSSFCCDSIQKKLSQVPSNISIEEARVFLEKIAIETNQDFIENQGKTGGTTSTFGIITQSATNESIAVITNLGDSRAYICRQENQNQLICLTSDDNYIKNKYRDKFLELQEKFDRVTSLKELTDFESILFNHRNKINNFFGSDNISPETISVVLHPGDILLLTTDGIHDNLTTTEILQTLSANQKSSEIVRNLIQKSSLRSQDQNHFRHKSDDMTAIAIKVN